MKSKISEKRIYDVLKDMRLPANFKGYKYIKDAIIMIENDNQIKIGKIYSTIAEKYSASSYSTERAIRHSIEYIFEFDDTPNIIKNIFGDGINKKPKNSEFLFTVTEYLKTH